MKKLSLVVTFPVACLLVQAQQTVVQLYNGTAPGSENLKQKEMVTTKP